MALPTAKRPDADAYFEHSIESYHRGIKKA